MGKYQNGILGAFSGTVGTVVGATTLGIDYMRSLPKKRSVPQSEAEKQQTDQFGVVSSFINPMRKLLDFGFRDYAKDNGKTGTNVAQSYTMKNALVKGDTGYYLLCEYIQVCRGMLPNVEEALAGSDKPGQVTFRWENNAGRGKAKDTDTAILGILCPELNACISVLDGPMRRTGIHIIDIPLMMGKQVNTWLSFLSADKKDIATSLFTGQFILPAF